MKVREVVVVGNVEKVRTKKDNKEGWQGRMTRKMVNKEKEEEEGKRKVG